MKENESASNASVLNCCSTIRTWLNIGQGKVVACWRSGREGKIALCVAAMLLILMSSCLFGGNGDSPVAGDLRKLRVTSLDELAVAVVRADMAAHWKDFHKPLRATEFTISDVGCYSSTVSFAARFEPTGREYYVRADAPSGTGYFDSLSVNANHIVEPSGSGPGRIDQKVADRLNSLCRHAANSLPSLQVFRRLSSDEMEATGFRYSIQYEMHVANTKDGRFMLDPSIDEPVRLRTNDERRFFEISHVGVTAEYINMQTNLFPILATGRPGQEWIAGKWKKLYDAYKAVGDAAADNMSEISNLQLDATFHGMETCATDEERVEMKKRYDSHYADPSVKAKVSRMRQFVEDTISILKNLPDRPSF